MTHSANSRRSVREVSNFHILDVEGRPRAQHWTTYAALNLSATSEIT